MIELRGEVTCLHCWSTFKPRDIWSVSVSRELRGDPQLSEDDQLRFLPTRYDVEGNAIDAQGGICHELACPSCRLTLPRAILDRDPMFVSILGSAESGKSYYLAVLAAKLRSKMPSLFHTDFRDADPAANQILRSNEEQLFLRQNPDEPVALGELIEKTQIFGNLYSTVRYGQDEILYPKPFSFLTESINGSLHRNVDTRRIICLYDNAGEHFLPGADSSSAPGTRHMAKSSFLLFVFDPTQDPRWHRAVQDAAEEGRTVQVTRQIVRQEDILREAAARIRRFGGMGEDEKTDQPLIILMAKADSWTELLPDVDWSTELVKGKNSALVNLKAIQNHSQTMRKTIHKHIPELVYAAESFSRRTFYVPVSALGSAPTSTDEDGRPMIKPKEIKPWRVINPFLLGLTLSEPGFIPETK